MDAPRSAGAPVSSPAAAQRCAEGAGLDSGVLAAAQSAMLSIAAAAAMIADMISTRAAAFDDPSATARICTRLTDVTPNFGTSILGCQADPRPYCVSSQRFSLICQIDQLL